jgi:hypothetical protein
MMLGNVGRGLSSRPHSPVLSATLLALAFLEPFACIHGAASAADVVDPGFCRRQRLKFIVDRWASNPWAPWRTAQNLLFVVHASPPLAKDG